VVINWPGGRHHAQAEAASGYCYFNDIVLCIMRLIAAPAAAAPKPTAAPPSTTSTATATTASRNKPFLQPLLSGASEGSADILASLRASSAATQSAAAPSTASSPKSSAAALDSDSATASSASTSSSPASTSSPSASSAIASAATATTSSAGSAAAPSVASTTASAGAGAAPGATAPAPRSGRRRVLYLDIDIHHGDGVQQAFYWSDRVCTVSFHCRRRGFFPGTGAATEIGEGKGRYRSINVPLADGSSFPPLLYPFTFDQLNASSFHVTFASAPVCCNTGVTDVQFVQTFESTLDAVWRAFRPDAVVLQCGVDSLASVRGIRALALYY
jgi:hypothetical protein